MGIIEFMEARIAEDEAEAIKYQAYEQDISETAGWWEPSRVLAECAAKRAVIEHHKRVPDIYGDDAGDTCSICTETGPMPQGWPCLTVAALAAVYSDHPDYQQEWALTDS